MTPEQAAIIKSTVPVLVEHGETITTTFYGNLLRDHDELNNIFNTVHQKTGHQPRALAMSLYAYASNIDDLGKLSPAVELICQKHASMYIKAEHYDVVGEYLLAAMKQVLGDALTPEIAEAWGVAYWELANIMINREKALYDSADGWTDWRKFKIAKKVQETEEITSFYFEPLEATDGSSGKAKPLPAFKPGQYVSVKLYVPALDKLQSRQYSLSDRPVPDYYRISVKREKGINLEDPEHAAFHPGYVSNLLHDEYKEGDTVELSHPFGDFYIEDKEAGDKDAPVVLISAGVGLTCLTSILNDLVAKNDNRPVSFIHGARNGKLRPFKQSLQELARSHKNVDMIFFDKTPARDAKKDEDYHYEGRLNLDVLDKEKDLYLSSKKTHYFVCGPEKFMNDVDAKLLGFGVEPERIHLELFGTGGVVRAQALPKEEEELEKMEKK